MAVHRPFVQGLCIAGLCRAMHMPGGWKKGEINRIGWKVRRCNRCK